MDEGFVGWMKMEDEGEKMENGNGERLGGKREREKRKTRLSVGSKADREMEREIPLPQQPKEVQVKGVRVCRECWGVVS